MKSDIKIGQRFQFVTSDAEPRTQTATVTRVLSDWEEGLSPEADFYIADWIEAETLSLTGSTVTLTFGLGTDGNVYLDGRRTEITLIS
jgi:hypothetical protein